MDLKKMTYEEKTDYLVSRIDALTEKVEKLIEMINSPKIDLADKIPNSLYQENFINK